MFVTPEVFIETHLPEVKLPMQVLIISYNSIFGYKEGVTEKEINGVKLTVQSGYVLSTSLLERGCARDENLYRDVQEKLFKDVTALRITNETNLFAVVYAGNNLFDQALACAAGIKICHKKSEVHVLTCDCEYEKKAPHMEACINSQTIDGFLISRQCGGGKDLMDILFAFFEKCKM
jgi:protein involved in ribonucleotide reduction